MIARIALATLYTNHIARLVALTNPSKQAYCDRWGYDFVTFEGTLDPTRPPSWSKLLFVKDLLDQYDWVFWLDADALIMNPDIPLERFVDPNYSFIVGKQPGPDPFGNLHLNLGSFFVKSDEKGRSLLDEIYAQEEFINHVSWEQEAFLHLFSTRRDIRERVKVEVDARRFNAIANSYAKGDFVFHALSPMRTEQGKIDLINKIIEQDARIPDPVEPMVDISIIVHDEEMSDTLEFTVPSLASDNAAVEKNSLRLVRAYESAFGDISGHQHINRFRYERIMEILAGAKSEVLVFARPGIQFFPGWRRKLLVALGKRDFGVATGAGGAPVGDLIVMRNNARVEKALDACWKDIDGGASFEATAEDYLAGFICRTYPQDGNGAGPSWTMLGSELVASGPATELNPMQVLSLAVYVPERELDENGREGVRAMRANFDDLLDRLRQTIISN